MIIAIGLAVGWGIVVATMGAILTEVGTWYHGLRKPSWQPPVWAFGPAWTLILSLASIAFYLSWHGAETAADQIRLVVLFGVNGALNILWSPLFFRFRRPDWALIEVPFLWLSILALILGVAQFSHAASLLLAPYLAWVSFAAFLNLTIVRLNRPFTAA